MGTKHSRPQPQPPTPPPVQTKTKEHYDITLVSSRGATLLAKLCDVVIDNVLHPAADAMPLFARRLGTDSIVELHDTEGETIYVNLSLMTAMDVQRNRTRTPEELQYTSVATTCRYIIRSAALWTGCYNYV
jgi:hypothetical protein